MDRPLTVGVPRGGVSLISWLSEIAEANGFYRDEDLVVTSVPSSYAELDAMIASGAVPVIRRGPDADLAMTGDAPVVKVIAGVVSSAVFDIVSYQALSELTSLRGARIAVIHPRYGSTLALRLALRKAGLFDDDYEVIGVGSSPSRMEALHRGEVDATILTLPYRDDDPRLHVMCDLALVLDDFVASSIQANIEAVEAAGHRDAVIGYLAATIRAGRWLSDPDHMPAAVDWLIRTTGSSQRMARRSYQLMRERGLAADCEIPVGGLRAMLEELSGTGDAKGPTDIREYVFADYLYQARQRADMRVRRP